MKIVLATFGSRGDVQPMLALSLAFIKAGHDVLLAGPPEKAPWAEMLGCPYKPLGDNFTAFIDDMKEFQKDMGDYYMNYNKDFFPEGF